MAIDLDNSGACFTGPSIIFNKTDNDNYLGTINPGLVTRQCIVII